MVRPSQLLHPQRQPATPRPAATVLLLRDVPGGFTAEPDIMDTWATSSISPQLSAGGLSSSVIPAKAGR